MNKRLFLKFLGVFGASALLTGCGTNTEPKPQKMVGKANFEAPLYYAPYVPVSVTKSNVDVGPTGLTKGKVRYKTEDAEIVYSTNLIEPEKSHVSYQQKVLTF